ncbi:MAG TPA: AMP-binding protein, partial [Mycobacterium sp.]|nr:AMP-binding protein [Mycobacterium sp.]
MTQPIPPISTQLSALAAAQADAVAVTCQGRTVSRAELDASTNRLAREYAARGVGVGDYVSIALPNSIEMIEALMACWKLGATPQPLSARLPDAEFAAILDLQPRALIVGRADPRGQTPSLPAGFTVDGSR